MSYMVCHGMKSKAGDIKNIEKHIERKNKDYKNKDIDKSKTHWIMICIMKDIKVINIELTRELKKNIQALELYGKNANFHG